MIHATDDRLAASRLRLRVAGFCVLLLACSLMRLLFLGHKSIMHDETLFVFYSYDQLYKSWTYNFLPILHGPTMLHLQALVFHVFGASDYTLRLGTALLGIGGFFWIWRLRPLLGEFATWFSLVFYTISPGLVFFHRFLHMDALLMFGTLWTVASLALWWHERRPAWIASAIFGWCILFCTKASSLFIYFSILTFLALLIIHDLTRALRSSRSRQAQVAGEKVAPPPNPYLVAGGLMLFVILVLTQVFEGIRYENDVTDAIGHDWVLRDVRSIPLALDWSGLPQETAASIGPAADGAFWRNVYLSLFVGAFVISTAFSAAVRWRLGGSQFLFRLWQRIHAARYQILGAAAGALILYLWIYTTGFKYRIGPFEIFAKTWSYWGGQHEWGRIGGPFHQHMLNMLIYELPLVLVVIGFWIGGLFTLPRSRAYAVSFFLMSFAFLVFDRLLFHDLNFSADGSAGTALHVPILRILALAGLLGALLVGFAPSVTRGMHLAYFVFIVGACSLYFFSAEWTDQLYQPLYRDGEAVRLANRHVHLFDYMEIRFNFDGGSSVAIVLILIFFAVTHTWSLLEQGRRFHAFLVWWLVTGIGAASYAREAVPQVGIHPILPLIMLSGVVVQGIWNRAAPGPRKYMILALIGVAAMWNAKASINLNFHNPDDPRERMVYGPTPRDLVHHCQFILDYRRIAPNRTEGDVLAWYRHHNDPRMEKDLRVGVTHDAVIWPVRWYLRDVEWENEPGPERFLRERHHFLFVKQSELASYPEISENYHTFIGSAIRFYQPRRLDSGKLADIWKEWIPGHYLDFSPQAGQAFQAKLEWRKIKDYLLHRRTFDGGIEGSGNISGTQYVFCVRKDLY